MVSGFDPRPLLISRSGDDLLDDERGESRHDYGSMRWDVLVLDSICQEYENTVRDWRSK